MSTSRISRVALAVAVISLLLATAPSVAAHVAPSMGASERAPAAISGVSVHYTIPLGKEPSGLAYDPTNFDVYISNEGSNNVTVISSTAHTHSSIPVGKSPAAVTYNPYNGDLYVPNLNSSNVSIISGSTNKVIANPSLGAHSAPGLAAFDPASGNMLVLNRSASLGTGVGWMIANGTNAVTKLTFGSETIPTYAYNPASKDLYIPNALSGTVSIVSGTGTVSSVKVGGFPEFVEVNPANNDTYVLPTTTTGKGLNITALSSANKIVKTIVVSTVNSVLANAISTNYDPSTKELYFVGYNSTSNRTSAVVLTSTNTVAATIAIGKVVGGLVYYDPANGDLDAPTLSKTIVVLSGTSIAKTLTVKQPVPVLVYDPTLKEMVGAGDVNMSTVSILYLISSANAVSSLKVGKYAIAPFYDPKDTYVYVVNIGSRTAELVG